MTLDSDSLLSIGTALEGNADSNPEGVALLYEDRRYTHRELNEAVNRYAHLLRSEGLGRDDVAIVMVDNRPELLMIIGAVAKLGGISSLINPQQRGGVLLHSINLARGRFFIIGEELLDAFSEVCPELGLGSDERTFFLPETGERGAPAGAMDLSLALGVQPVSNPGTTRTVRFGDPYAYVFTSGTTGLPKASIQTHRRWYGGRYWFGRLVMDFKSTDVMYCPLPFCHTNALNVAWGTAGGIGGTLAIRRRFSATHFLDDVRRFGADTFIYIGELCRYLLNQPPRPDDADNPLVRCVGNGLRPDIWEPFKRRFGIEKIYEFYGSAEGTLVFTNVLNADRTAGMAFPPYGVVRYDIEAEEPVRGADGFMMRVPPGECGLVLGPISDSTPFAGYTDGEETDRKVFRDVFKKGDAWFNFGDLVLNQGYRHVQFKDRLGDTFRWKGENVSTTEVERVVNSRPDVGACAVYGVRIPGTDGRAGMVALVPSGTPGDLDLQGLADRLRSELPPYAVPRFVRLTGVLETTGTHKIKKFQLREEGFDPECICDPLFVMLPGGESYVELTADIYREIADGLHRF